MSELIQINALAPLQGVRKTSKVMLLFPPEWVPTAPYLAMPSLTAVLRQEGHQVVQRDINIEMYDHFFSLDFLIWITAARPGDKQPTWGPSHDQLTHGDLVLLFFAHEGLRDTVEGLGAPTLRKRAPFMHHALCWLAYPEDFTQGPSDATPRFDPWIKGVGSCILEALQPELAARWIHVESGKERIEQPTLMRALGTSQDKVLDAFLTAAEKAKRR
jgi:hypothetical protein